MDEIQEAIEQAAGADDGAINHLYSDTRTTPSPRRISGAREVIKRFLQNVPEHLTVSDLLNAIE